MRHAFLLLLLLAALVGCPSTEPEVVDFDGDGVPDEQDCAPADPTVYPGAVEIVGDGTDQDCDGLDDIDADGDGSPSLEDCDDANDLLDALDRDADGFSLCDGDCDDTDDAIHPDATEIPGDGVDQDCDENDDIDADGDGTFSLLDCDDDDPTLNQDDLDGDGASNCAGDCDDTDASLNPNDVDGDSQTSCDGDCDDEDADRTALDADGDGATTCQAEPDCDDTSSQLNLHDVDGDTYSTCEGDCADTDATRSPGATEQCNGLDDDCDGGLPSTELDGDGDGDIACLDCDDTDGNITGLDTDLDGFSPCDGDCAEGNGTIYPGATDSFGDGIDQNCDDTDGVDADGDGVAANATTPDCDDGDASIYPGAPEICDGIDSDCVPDPTEVDGDSDGAAPCEGDCDDADAALNLQDVDGDGLDTCAGDCDDNDATQNLTDNDGDGLAGCDGDCDDVDPNINPSAAEVCDGVDNDCDGVIGSPDTFVQPPGPDIQGTTDQLLCGVFAIGAAAEITGWEMRLAPSSTTTVTFGLFEGPSPTGPWTREWVSAPAGVTSISEQWFASGPVGRTLTAGSYTALCVVATEDIAWPGDYSNTGLPTTTSFGTYVSAIDEIEITAMPLAMASSGWESYVPIQVHTITSEADGDGDGESACTDCDDGDATISNSDGDGDGLTGCAGDCDDADATIPATGWEAPWDTVDSDCDGTDATDLEGAAITILGGDLGRLGTGVVVVPDVDSDGLDDLWVSEPDHDGAFADTGRVVLLSGAALLAGTADLDTPLASIVGTEADDAVGEDVVALPDLDADGFPELAVWSSEIVSGQSSRAGEVLIFSSQNGTWGGLGVTPAAAALHITPQYSGEPFSAGLTAGGDLDGDGVFDLVIPSVMWSLNYQGDEGAALVFTAAQITAALGGAALEADDAWLILMGQYDSALMGGHVAFLPDMDSDGRHELLVGSVLGPRTWTGTQYLYPNAGQVHLVLSTSVASGGLCTVAITGCSTVEISGTAYGDRWYRALHVGDLDSDGLPDIAIGSSFVAGSGNLRGAIGVYTGASLLLGGTLGTSDADGWIEGAADLDLLGSLHATAGDLDGDGLPELLSAITDVATSGFARPGTLVIPGTALAASLTTAGTPTVATEAFAAVDGDAATSTGGALGDLDGDGSAEFWLGAPYRDVNGLSDGALHILEVP